MDGFTNQKANEIVKKVKLNKKLKKEQLSLDQKESGVLYHASHEDEKSRIDYSFFITDSRTGNGGEYQIHNIKNKERPMGFGCTIIENLKVRR